MTVIPATEAKNHFGELLEAIQRSPVEIARKGRSVAVVMSMGEYQEMKRRLGEIEQPTDFSGLRTWRKRVAKSRKSGVMDLSEYHQHLDVKYGS
jgi:prevent-host-death family protein